MTCVSLLRTLRRGHAELRAASEQASSPHILRRSCIAGSTGGPRCRGLHPCPPLAAKPDGALPCRVWGAGIASESRRSGGAQWLHHLPRPALRCGCGHPLTTACGCNHVLYFCCKMLVRAPLGTSSDMAFSYFPAVMCDRSCLNADGCFGPLPLWSPRYTTQTIPACVRHPSILFLAGTLPAWPFIKRGHRPWLSRSHFDPLRDEILFSQATARLRACPLGGVRRALHHRVRRFCDSPVFDRGFNFDRRGRGRDEAIYSRPAGNRSAKRNRGREQNAGVARG